MRHLLAGLTLILPLYICSQNTSKLVHQGPTGRLLYAEDERGNKIPDFSRSGYKGGGIALPDIPVQETLEPATGNTDDTDRIQQAIDRVSAMKPMNGFRGAVLLKHGTYRIDRQLYIQTSGVVLRGEGQMNEGTVLLATGKENRILISMTGKREISMDESNKRKISDAYVPWGAMSFSLESSDGLSAGDSILIYRPGTKAWIHTIMMDQIVERRGTMQWQPGEYDFYFERIIQSIDGNRITIDAPVMNAMEDIYGGGFVYPYRIKGRIINCGVENLRLISEYETGKEDEDENHAFIGIQLDDAANAWIKNVTTQHFSHCVQLDGGAIFCTVQDCACLKPVSIITGGRRYAFTILGQCCLVQRCYSEDARHAEITGSRVPGPNVFLDCLAINTHADIGPHHRWAMGILWDNLKGGEFNAQDRGNWGSGHGWAGAQQVFWNCETDSICVQMPPTAQNYAIGCTGKIIWGRFPDRVPGYYESQDNHVEPRSLYLAQLEDRLGKTAVENVTIEAQRNGSIYNILKLMADECDQ